LKLNLDRWKNCSIHAIICLQHLSQIHERDCCLHSICFYLKGFSSENIFNKIIFYPKNIFLTFRPWFFFSIKKEPYKLKKKKEEKRRRKTKNNIYMKKRRREKQNKRVFQLRMAEPPPFLRKLWVVASRPQAQIPPDILARARNGLYAKPIFIRAK